MTKTDIHAEEFLRFMSAEQVSLSPAVNAGYASDWTRSNRNVPGIVLFPKTTEEVVRVVKYANQHNLTLIPSGGRTGLTGAVSVLKDEIVLSLEKMNKILEYDPIDRLVRCEAGTITQEVKNYVNGFEAEIPLDLAARGSSQIGGNIATNAGGLNVIKYGMVRNWVAGLRVVTGSGEELNLQDNLVKDNSGYNLFQPFIGSEGTLGIITEVSLRLVPIRAETRVIAVAFQSIEDAVELFSKLRETQSLNCFELFDAASYRLVLSSYSDLKDILPKNRNFYCVIDFSIFPDWEEYITDTLAGLRDSEIGETAIVADLDREKKLLWDYREKIAEAVVRKQFYQTDVSVRISKVSLFIERLTKAVTDTLPQVEFMWFGHLGDGNIHVIALKPEALDPADFSIAAKSFIHIILGLLKDMGGSFSAEHGVGISKKEQFQAMKTPFEKLYHKQLKEIFDPNKVLNPGKITD